MVPQQPQNRTRILQGMYIATLLLLGSTLGLSYPTFAQTLENYDVDQSTGYRMDRYRAPVPADIPGGITIDTTALQALLKTDKRTVLLDVYPPKGLGPDPLDGSWVTNEKRKTVPGAIWLPEVGRGSLQANALDYLQRNLTRLSDADTTTPLVFFCTADCWQSWNAARRAMTLGYTSVYWYPLGSDGWQESGNAVTTVQPVNFLDDTTPENDQLSESTDTSIWPDNARIYLIDQSGNELDVGQVTFSDPQNAVTGVDVEMDSEKLIDQFLSMRPFRCLTETSEWFCYLPYPYELNRTIAPDDLTELEYQLLFIWKSPKTFGIDAWNGVYYKLSRQDDGSIAGELLQGDLNVLADPPEKFSHPIDLYEFIDEGADNRLFPSLIIRP